MPRLIKRKKFRSRGYYNAIEIDKRSKNMTSLSLASTEEVDWFAEERELVERRLQVINLQKDYKDQKLGQLTLCQKMIQLFWTIYNYLFIMYDGIGVFGFAFYKIPRLRGTKPNLLTKFRDPFWVVQTTFVFGISGYIVLANFFGQQTGKLAGIEYLQQTQYQFKIDETMFLFAHVRLSKNEILRTYQFYLDQEKRRKEQEDAEKLKALEEQ